MRSDSTKLTTVFRDHVSYFHENYYFHDTDFHDYVNDFDNFDDLA